MLTYFTLLDVWLCLLVNFLNKLSKEVTSSTQTHIQTHTQTHGLASQQEGCSHLLFEQHDAPLRTWKSLRVSGQEEGVHPHEGQSHISCLTHWNIKYKVLHCPAAVCGWLCVRMSLRKRSGLFFIWEHSTFDHSWPHLDLNNGPKNQLYFQSLPKFSSHHANVWRNYKKATSSHNPSPFHCTVVLGSTLAYLKKVA